MSLQKKLIITGLLAGACNTAIASGFALSGKSTSGLGTALSGTTVLADDASVVYNNPAAMRDLQGDYYTAQLHIINTDIQFDDQGSNITGNGSQSIKKNHFVPNLYYVTTLNQDVSFGLGIYSPMGLGIEYDEDWVGRYLSTDSSLRTINISPAFAFTPNDKFNLGVGVDFQYAEAELNKAIDFDTICTGSGIAGCTDGSNKLSGDSWAVGYSLGLTY
ncbi:MAG: hypothetical protein GWO23_09615, partial [Gammaproteobacteria bacterium]|nr:hypothetical protein [Gammaproteobacteria bacterium]